MISDLNWQYRIVGIGASAGGINILPSILAPLPDTFDIPIVIIQHIGKDGGGFLPEYLGKNCRLKVREAEQLRKATAGYVYIAPADYHLYIDSEFRFSFSVDAKVHYSRPSIDVFFESASYALPGQVIGVLLTGANNDGASGMLRIKEGGGMTLVQDPETAEAKQMPSSAIEVDAAEYVLPPEKIPELLLALSSDNRMRR